MQSTPTPWGSGEGSALGVKRCACGCGEALPAGARSNQKYVDAKHRKRMEERRRRRRRREESGKPVYAHAKPTDDQGFEYRSKEQSRDGRATARRGRGYDYFVTTDWPQLLSSGEVKQSDALKVMEKAWPDGVPAPSQANVSRWMAAYHEDQALGAARDQHEPDLSHTDDLGSFTRRYFPDLLVPDFHLEWEADIDEVVGTGGRLLILGPQRFGKTELLTRYCMKRIAQDPNISIGWVSKTAALAERMVGYVRQNLEHNETFIEDVLGPGQTFQPPTRSGHSWTNSEFTVSTRTRIRKSPTMEAMGVGGTIMGKDFDLIILDDPQDRTRCLSPSQREKDVEWMFTDFLSRKEEHTGVAFIMSRQHIDDLPGNIIKDHGDKWKVKVYRAHDPGCTIPEADVDGHRDCLLWPEKRSWAWLLPQKQQNEAHFQRNYMNNPTTDALTLITAKDLERCKDKSRRVGEVRSDWRLIAGIDPAAAKLNAAVLFGWDGEKRHVVDIMEAEAGIRGGRTILRTWREKYGCTQFVLEKNIAEMWWQDREITDMLKSGWVNLEPHYTSRINKHDPSHGVVAMFSHMRREDPTITFPAGDRESLEKMERLFRTLLIFDPDYVNHKHVDDDLPMAMWFPQSFMDRWSVAWVERAIVEYDQTPYQFRTGYPSQSNMVTRRARARSAA